MTLVAESWVSNSVVKNLAGIMLLTTVNVIVRNGFYDCYFPYQIFYYWYLLQSGRRFFVYRIWLSFAKFSQNLAYASKFFVCTLGVTTVIKIRHFLEILIDLELTQDVIWKICEYIWRTKSKVTIKP